MTQMVISGNKFSRGQDDIVSRRWKTAKAVCVTKTGLEVAPGSKWYLNVNKTKQKGSKHQHIKKPACVTRTKELHKRQQQILWVPAVTKQPSHRGYPRMFLTHVITYLMKHIVILIKSENPNEWGQWERCPEQWNSKKAGKKRHIEYSWIVSRQDLNELKVKHKYLFSCDCSDIFDGLCSVNIKNEEKWLNNLHQISVI